MPDWKPEILRRLASLKLAPAREAEIVDELSQHLDDRYEELVSRGEAAESAERAALEELREEDLLARSLRPAEGTPYREPIAPGKDAGNFFSGILQDVRYADRMLRKSPGFTTVAILTLALGIGATTAIFTVVNQVLLESTAVYPHSNRIVLLVQRSGTGSYPLISIPEYLLWRSQTRILEDVTATPWGAAPVNLLGGDHPEQLQAQRVTANYFALFGFRITLGRTFTAKEDVPGGPPVAVITYELWKSRFGSNRKIVGKVIDLDNTPSTVIGVLSPLPSTDAGTVDVFLPLQPDPNSTNQGVYLYGLGRLKPGVSLVQADAALKVATDQFRHMYPGVLGTKETFATEKLSDLLVAGVKKTLLIFFGAVGFVLLVACANFVNLLLARQAGMQSEIAIRIALGASRGRIIRHILSEGVLLSLGGGVLGLFFGYAGVRALLAINPGQLPQIGPHGEAVTVDWRVLLFALAISAIAGVLSGLLPAIKAAHTNVASMVNESGSRAATSLRHNKTRSLLVIVEMALAVVLLAGAGLLIRTLREILKVSPGFETRNILTMDMSVAGQRFAKTSAVAELVRQGEQRLDRLPGVFAAAATCCLPLEPGYGMAFDIEARAPIKSQHSGFAAWRSISPGYFRALGIPLLRGRDFTVHDSGSSQPVIVINEAMAKQYWPVGGELGTRITAGVDLGPQWAEPPREIVGVVGDVRDNTLNSKPLPTMYVPVAQVTDRINANSNSIKPLSWIIRTRVAPLSLSHEIKHQLRLASGGLPVGNVRTMGQIVAQSTGQNSFDMTLLVIFAALALLLAAIGVYGVLAYSVEQRTREIGIRMALGASPDRVRRTIARQGVVLAVVGLVIGVGAGLGVTRLLKGLLFGVKPWDPIAFVGAAFALIVVALLACYIPARRATRIDPLIALRYE